MRKFRLLSEDESKSFSLFGNSIVVTDVSGLGINLDIIQNEGANKNYISDVNPNFENISLTIYFGVNGNAYNDYYSLLSFISCNGKKKLILEYSILNDVKYCDVWLKSAPKTQKDTTNTINSTFVFVRSSYWYTKELIGFNLKAEYIGSDFPLDIPISFTGTSITNDVSISNTFFENYPVDILILGPTTKNTTIELIDEKNSTINKIVVKSKLSTNDWFRINGFTNKISYYNSTDNKVYDGYNMINHVYDSFITVPNGKYRVHADISSGDQFVVIVHYKKWRID